MISLQLIDVKKPTFLKSTHLKNCLKELIFCEKKITGDISIVLTTDEYVLKVNQDFLQHDYYTDIISFDYSTLPIVSGEIFISVDRVKENAEVAGVDFENEFIRVVSHGLLHLLGYKDKTAAQAKEMRQEEEACLSLWADLG